MERVLLVGTHLKNSGAKTSASLDSLEELGRLAETAGGRVADKMLQSIETPHPATFIGRGKVEEIRQRALKKEFNTVIFDDELKPAQHKNLAEIIPAKILDRTRLILDIFARRARTREGILQVELAQISYLLPRITERYGRFEQQVGGIGTRGPGERKLEVEARHIRDRMAHLKHQIESVKQHRETARERRHSVPLPVAAIVGYTNAGKSTLLNRIVKLYGQSAETVYADDKLFATLDPTTRRVRMPSGRWGLFTDTVGFIHKLPHHLIAAFRSTLEETLGADVLIHVVDACDPHRESHFKTVLQILKSLEENPGACEDKMIICYNKTDRLTAEERKNLENSFALAGNGSGRAAPPLCISAVTGAGVNALLNRIEEKLSATMFETELYVPFSRSSVLSALYRLGQVQTVSHEKKGVRLRLRLEKSHWKKIKKIFDSGAGT